MSCTPPMTFAVGDLDKSKHTVDGPIVAYWGQEGEEYYRGEMPLDYGERPRLRIIDRARRGRIWKLTLRIQPPEGVALKEHRQDIARILGLPYAGDGDLRPEYRATWIPGSCKARTAAGAFTSATRVFERLGGLTASAAQVRVEEWTA